MGRPAHVLQGICANTRLSVEGESVYNEIRELLDEPQSADLPRIERTLTDGYARALSLEAERLRVERQIAEIASALARGDEAQMAELSALGRRLKDSDDALTKLRTLLAALRERADEARDVA
jgi:ABC-type phosphate transport system auxiliary subunit